MILLNMNVSQQVISLGMKILGWNWIKLHVMYKTPFQPNRACDKIIHTCHSKLRGSHAATSLRCWPVSMTHYEDFKALWSSYLWQSDLSKSNIENMKLVLTNIHNGIHTIMVKIWEVHVAVYKHPAVSWPAYVLLTYLHPSVYASDFSTNFGNWRHMVHDKNSKALADT